MTVDSDNLADGLVDGLNNPIGCGCVWVDRHGSDAISIQEQSIVMNAGLWAGISGEPAEFKQSGSFL